MNDATKPRFGSTEGLFSGSEAVPDEDLPATRQPRSPAAPSTESPSEPTARPARKSAKPARRQHFVYAAVSSEVRALAPRIAARTEKTVADLVVLGVELLQDDAFMDEPAVIDGPPLSRPSSRPDLADMQIRVTPAQRDWIEAARSKQRGVSLRRFSGAALTAYVRTHHDVVADLEAQ